MEIERRLTCEKVTIEPDSKRASGYGAVFSSNSEDLGGFIERIAPGAFDNALNDDVRALFNHDPSLILGRTVSGTLSLSVDERGLKYDIDMPDTTYANDLRESLKRGDVDQSSFGFTVKNDSWDEVDGQLVRTILEVNQLFDVSPVTYPAYPDTAAAVRSMDKRNESILEKKNELEHEAREREIVLMG